MEGEGLQDNGKSLLKLWEDFATKSQRAKDTENAASEGKLAAKAQQAGCWAVHGEQTTGAEFC